MSLDTYVDTVQCNLDRNNIAVTPNNHEKIIEVILSLFAGYDHSSLPGADYTTIVRFREFFLSGHEYYGDIDSYMLDRVLRTGRGIHHVSAALYTCILEKATPMRDRFIDVPNYDFIGIRTSQESRQTTYAVRIVGGGFAGDVDKLRDFVRQQRMSWSNNYLAALPPLHLWDNMVILLQKMIMGDREAYECPEQLAFFRYCLMCEQPEVPEASVMSAYEIFSEIAY
jgi:hypothetical protein